MNNECHRCGAYMVDPSTPDRCDKCEIERLRQENSNLLETVKSYQKGVVEQIEREQRLRKAIRRFIAICDDEVPDHNCDFYNAPEKGVCEFDERWTDLWEIAREEQ